MTCFLYSAHCGTVAEFDPADYCIEESLGEMITVKIMKLPQTEIL